MEDLGQCLLVELAIDRTVLIDSLFGALFIVRHDQARDKFAKENCTSISKNGSILLRTVCLNAKLRVGHNAALKHDGAWLVHGNPLVTQASIVIGHSTIAINDRLLSFARIDLLDVLPQLFVQFLLLLLPEKFLVNQSNRLRHRLNHLFV